MGVRAPATITASFIGGASLRTSRPGRSESAPGRRVEWGWNLEPNEREFKLLESTRGAAGPGGRGPGRWGDPGASRSRADAWRVGLAERVTAARSRLPQPP